MYSGRQYFAFATSLIATSALLLTACGSAGGDNDDAGMSAGSTSAPSGEEYSNSLSSSERGAGGSSQDSSKGIAPVGATASTGTETSNQESLPFDRKIIFTTAIDLSVPDVTATFNEVQRLARLAGGYVESSNLSVLAGDDQSKQRASVTLRVPSTEYDNTLNQLRVLPGGKVTREEAKSNEVTEQYVDLESRMRNLQTNEAKYLELLGQAKTIDEIMKVNDRLSEVRAQIEQAKGRLNVLDHMTAMATIDVAIVPLVAAAQVEEPKPESNGIASPVEAFQAALEKSADALRVLAAAGAVAVVGLGWLIPVAGIALVGRRFVRNRWPVAATPNETPSNPPATPSV